jgi:hypothetical protein
MVAPDFLALVEAVQQQAMTLVAYLKNARIITQRVFTPLISACKLPLACFAHKAGVHHAQPLFGNLCRAVKQ